MKNHNNYPHFIYLGNTILAWYKSNARNLPFRQTKDPYLIWICEVVFQQTKIAQGLAYYKKFVLRFPNVETLANASVEDVLLFWKGLGYYSRAINLHKAAQQILNNYNGCFPKDYSEILKLKGVGKYTGAAIASICFGLPMAAVDGNFYRVFSRLFADSYDISKGKAFDYFSDLALQIMPKNNAGDFNQAIMDIGSEICTPTHPKCDICPISGFCLAFQSDTISMYPVKSKKTVIKKQDMHYFFVHFQNKFCIQQRGEDFIWKKLFEFPLEIDLIHLYKIYKKENVQHTLTHLKLNIDFNCIELSSNDDLIEFAIRNDFEILSLDDFHLKSFPKPLENFILKFYQKRIEGV